MIKAKGLIYRTADDVKNLLYMTTPSKELEKRWINNKFHLDELSNGLKYEFSSKDISFFTDQWMTLIFIPQEIITEFEYKKYLLEMNRDPLLTPSDDKISKAAYLNELIEGIDNYFDEKENLYAIGAEKIIEQPCYVFMFNHDRLKGVYAGIPTRLFDGPLSKNVVYNCNFCDHFERTDFDIPDFYYDEYDRLYCPECAKEASTRKFQLRHVGE